MVMSGVYKPGGLSNFETVNGGTEPVLIQNVQCLKIPHFSWSLGSYY